MLSQPTSTRVSAKLTITGPHNFSAIEFLTSNDNLLVGSSSRCRLCLDGGSVSPIHCLLKLVDEQLYVQEWSMSTGTQVDGKRVEGEMAVPRSSTIALGDYRIRHVLVCDDSPFSEREQSPADEWAEKQASYGQVNHGPDDGEGASPPQDPDAPQHPLDKAAVNTSLAAEAVHHSDISDSGLAADQECLTDDSSLDAINALDSHLGNEGPLDDSLDSARDEDGSTSVSRSSLLMDSFEQETIDMLQAELEHLQSELAVRDAQIAELNAAEPSAKLPDEATADSSIDTAALVTRLEQLLDEAERSDERIRVMEDLLRAADEANQAEQEERRELEAWVSDIEKRIGQRESEWQAEMATLEHRVQIVTAERDHVERRLQLAASPDTARSESDGVLMQLRQQNRELDEKLQTARKLHAELEKRLAQLDDQDSPRAQQVAIEEALREERAKLAQERASVTRMRAEITAKLAEAQAVAGNRSTEIESRLRMYREHLKEIHDNEKDGRPAKVERTLSARIARIWKQLDG